LSMDLKREHQGPTQPQRAGQSFHPVARLAPTILKVNRAGIAERV
jgi:hypothetical protein